MEAFAAGPSREAVETYTSALPPDVAALLAETGLADELARKQKRWHDVKVCEYRLVLSCIAHSAYQSVNKHSVELMYGSMHLNVIHVGMIPVML